MRRALYFLTTIFLVLFARTSLGVDRFASLTPTAVTTMALSEDHLQLVVAHESENQLTVWDVKTNKLAKTIECPAPRSVLWRGDRVFVANFGKGTISILDVKQDWKTIKQVQAGMPQVFYLSAPQKKFFMGQMLAMCLSPQQGMKLFWVDTGEDKSQFIMDGSNTTLASVDFAGRYFMLQHYANVAGIYDFAPTKDGLRPKPIWSSLRGLTIPPAPFQVRRDTFWFGHNQVAKGMPPLVVSDMVGGNYQGIAHGRFVVPDRNREVFYRFGDEEITCVNLDVKLTTRGTRVISYPTDSNLFQTLDGPAGIPKSLRPTIQFSGRTYGHQIAVTHDDELTFYILDRVKEKLFTLKTASSFKPPFPDDPPDEPEPIEDGKFIEVDPVEPVTGLAMMEDGRHLLLSHEGDDRVSVWDIAARKSIASFETTRPRYLLCRGEKVYVANFGKGTVSIFARDKDWKADGQVEVGNPNVVYLSAPHGKFFQGKILATSDSPDGSSDKLIALLDATSGSREPLPIRHMATSSFDGRYFLASHRSQIAGAYPFPGSKSNFITAIGASQRTPLGRQIRPDKHWFGQYQLYEGTFPKPLGESVIEKSSRNNVGNCVIPDQSRHVVYRIKDSRLTCQALDSKLTQVKTRGLTLPAVGKNEIIHGWGEVLRPTDFNYPHAVTIGDQTFLFLFDGNRRAVYHASIPKFQLNPLIAAAAAIECGEGKTLPPAIPTDKAQSIALLDEKNLGETAAKFEIESGPDGVSVNESGVLSWTPNRNNIGHHRILVSGEVDGHAMTLKIDTRVVLPENLERALANPTSIENAGRHFLTGNYHTLSYNHDGTAILLANGNSLRVLDSSGVDVISTHSTKQSYRAIAARKDYYVALGATLDLLDKETLEPLSTITFPTGNQGTISLHPAKKTCYVTLIRPNYKTDPIRGYQVVEVDEVAGVFRELGRVYGTHPTCDPRGRFLYTRIAGVVRTTKLIDGRQHSTAKVYSDLLCYSLRDGGSDVQFLRKNGEVGPDFGSFVVSSDGQSIACLTRNSAKREVLIFKSGADGKPSGLAVANYPTQFSYHPTLPIVAATDGQQIMFFDRKSGARRESLLDLAEGETMRYITNLFFAPSGTHLLVTYRDTATPRQMVRSIRLKLSPDELTAGGYARPMIAAFNDAPETTYSPQHLEGLLGAKTQAKSPTEISRDVSGAIVSVQGNDVQGSGVVIGKSGYVLTSAELLPPFESPSVLIQINDESQWKTKRVEATIVRADAGLNLALLKLNPPGILQHANLAKGQEAQPAEDALIIAATTDGDNLGRSVERAYVVNANRVVNDKRYLEIAVSTESKLLGAPVFSSHGRVIGLVTSGPASSESAFSTTAADVIEFLGASGLLRRMAAKGTARRKWTDQTGGFQVDAELVSVSGGVAQLRRGDGKLIDIPVILLSGPDQAFIKKWQEE